MIMNKKIYCVLVEEKDIRGHYLYVEAQSEQEAEQIISDGLDNLGFDELTNFECPDSYTEYNLEVIGVEAKPNNKELFDRSDYDAVYGTYDDDDEVDEQ